jgi:hypothetical protein
MLQGGQQMTDLLRSLWRARDFFMSVAPLALARTAANVPSRVTGTIA